MNEDTVKKNLGLKLFRCDAKGKILDITDPFPTPVLFDPNAEGAKTPRFSLNYTKYNTETHSSEARHTHWVDVDTLRLLAWNLMTGKKGNKGEKGYTPILEEFKGGPCSSAGLTEKECPGGIVSRKLSVVYNDSLNIGPVYQFLFDLREGETGKKGQIVPLKDGKQFLKEMMNLSVDTAAKMGCRIYSYLTSKETIAIANAYQMK